MLAALVVVLRTVALICCGHRAVALENLALRQQLAVFRRTVERPPLRHRDRLFWILLAKAWREWRTALLVMQPDTVVRWHRQWLRRRWTRCSMHSRPGRPTVTRILLCDNTFGVFDRTTSTRPGIIIPLDASTRRAEDPYLHG
jgi:hypothetical protein